VLSGPVVKSTVKGVSRRTQSNGARPAVPFIPLPYESPPAVPFFAFHMARIRAAFYMAITQAMSIETKNGEAVVLTFSAERVQQDGNVIVLLDKQGLEAVQITLAEGTKHRIL
jgi:hypothetical protein